jgi:hypothetical protein
MARASTILASHRKTFAFQGCGALATQELAAAEEEGETTAMIFTLLQEQHKMQLD